MAGSERIIDLRKLLAERFPHPPPSEPARLKTGLRAIDLGLNGGLPKGAITELIAPHLSAGGASLIAGLLQSAQHGRYFLALIDGRDSFDPEPLGHECLRHLLWVRCARTLETIKAADLLLRDGNFPLVILDLALNRAEELRKIPPTTWYRLQRLVEPTATAFLVFSRRSMVGSAQLKVVLENRWTLKTFEQTERLDPDQSGAGFVSPHQTLLSRLPLRVQRSHLPGETMPPAAAV